MAFLLGAAVAATGIGLYYQYRLDQTDNRVNALINGYSGAFNNAKRDLASMTSSAESQIKNQLSKLDKSGSYETLARRLAQHLGPSVFFVDTQSVDGSASVGSAFVIASSPSRSLLLGSYKTVQAATVDPGPAVFVRKGSTNTRVTIVSWSKSYDFALMLLPRGGLHPLPVANVASQPQLGQRVYALSGLGTAGAAVSSGTISDVSAQGIADSIPLGPAFQGGPIVNSSGQLIAVASLSYAPLGFSSSGIWYAPYAQAACRVVVPCRGGVLSGASASRA